MLIRVCLWFELDCLMLFWPGLEFLKGFAFSHGYHFRSAISPLVVLAWMLTLIAEHVIVHFNH